MNKPASNLPWTVALTGGIASGKSMVSQRFAALSVSVHDADLAARDVVLPGTPGLVAISETFGPEVLAKDGTLDRRALRQVVFADPEARRQLESILHPLIHDHLMAELESDASPWCLLVIPLLAETWPRYDWVDRVLLVTAPQALRIERLMRRDGIDRTAAQRTLSAQAGDDHRLTLADDIIINDGGPTALDERVAALQQRYARLAAARPVP